MVGLEEGTRNGATFTLKDKAGQRRAMTVFAVWEGPTYSWRMREHAIGRAVDEDSDPSIEVYAGEGLPEKLEAPAVAARLCWAMSEAVARDGGSWALNN